MDQHYDLLRNPINLMWAVNCTMTQDSVRIGALYIEPDIPEENIRLESGSDKIDVVIPEEFLRQSTALRAWNVELPIKHE